LSRIRGGNTSDPEIRFGVLATRAIAVLVEFVTKATFLLALLEFLKLLEFAFKTHDDLLGSECDVTLRRARLTVLAAIGRTWNEHDCFAS
jgi:G:T-mismatch repair DNA endonuclease (very short patch repair protein)